MADSEDNMGALAPREAPSSGRDAIQRVGRAIRYGANLSAWMLAYGEWLVLECIEAPKVSERTKRARGLARAPVTINQLRELEKRDDFVSYCDELRKGPLEQARAKFAAAFPTYIERHRMALDIATDARDVNAIARLTEPVLDRVMPKKTEAAAAPTVQIILTQAQLQSVAAYTAPEMTVDAEVVEPDATE
jgi:hypothetical protein